MSLNPADGQALKCRMMVPGERKTCRGAKVLQHYGGWRGHFPYLKVTLTPQMMKIINFPVIEQYSIVNNL